MTAVLFVMTAATGAVIRHRVNLLGFGWRGTLAVNVVGAFLLGWIIAADPSASVRTVVGTALLGSLTTFSTFALEVAEGPVRDRVAVVTTNLVLGIGAAALGAALA